MFYVILVSHGDFAVGLHTALKMIAGDRETILSVGLQDGMGIEDFAAAFAKRLIPIQAGDQILLLADILGGSPLTTAMNVLASKKLLEQTQAFGGVNLAMALTAVLRGENCDGAVLKQMLLEDSRNAVQEFTMEFAEDEEI